MTRAHPASGQLRTAFEQHAVPLLRLCVLLTGRSQAAEDLVQESFIRLAPVVDDLSEDAVRAAAELIDATVKTNVS